MCPTSILTHIESRPNLELASGNCESWITKNRGACALTRAGGSLYTIKLKSACRELDLSLSGLDPVPRSKVGTRLLASWVAKGKIGTLLLASNAGSYSAQSYCKWSNFVTDHLRAGHCSVTASFHRHNMHAPNPGQILGRGNLKQTGPNCAVGARHHLRGPSAVRSWHRVILSSRTGSLSPSRAATAVGPGPKPCVSFKLFYVIDTGSTGTRA